MVGRVALPGFARSADRRAIDEFRVAMSEVGEEAAMFLAELCEMGRTGEVPSKDRSSVPELMTRYLGSWVIFYGVAASLGVVVLHAAPHKSGGGRARDREMFANAQKEALRRLSSL